MKIRCDFVSNSSSSSFIVIADSIGKIEDLSIYNEDGEFIVPNENIGKHEFGWEFETTSDFFSKLNFCAMQCFYSKEHCDEWFEMLKNVVKNNYNLSIKMVNLIDYGDFKDLPDDMYIDHQSASSEGKNTEMFKDEDTLLRFLSNIESYIEGGNDNV